MKNPRLRPCDGCGGDDYTTIHDGLTCVWSCSACGNFVAELIENTET